MKNCPHCKAAIEESARFCIYCMSSLEEKKTVELLFPKKKAPWIIGIAAGAAVLILVAFLLLLKSPSGDNIPQGTATTSSASANAIPSTTSTHRADKTDLVALNTSTTGINAVPTVPTAPAAASSTQQTTVTTAGNLPQTTTRTASKSTTKTTAKTTTKSASKTTTTTTTATETTVAVQADTYIYREAVHDDLYLDMTIAVPPDTVVITGVRTPSADGIYRVPNVIDGKRVVAIAAGAFAGEDVRVVVLPANMATVNEHAFSACPNLTDIYYASNAIYTYPAAFAPLSQRNGMLTIHCAWNCSNRNFRYYRNIATDWFGADYQEWNGGDIE